MAMGFYRRFAMAYGTIWLGFTGLVLLGGSFHLDLPFFLLLPGGCAVYAAVVKPRAAAALPAAAPQALPAAVAVRGGEAGAGPTDRG